jgi:hypothetical protein
MSEPETYTNYTNMFCMDLSTDALIDYTCGNKSQDWTLTENQQLDYNQRRVNPVHTPKFYFTKINF